MALRCRPHGGGFGDPHGRRPVRSPPATLQVCPDNLTAASGTCFGAASSNPAGQLHIGGGPAGDIDHSIENPVSSTTLTAQLIAAGSFIKTTAAGTATLSKNYINTGTDGVWPNCAGTYVSGCKSSPTKMILSNATNRQVTDGATSPGTLTQACVSSVTANFKAADVGMRISGGDLPDGAYPGVPRHRLRHCHDQRRGSLCGRCMCRWVHQREQHDCAGPHDRSRSCADVFPLRD